MYAAEIQRKKKCWQEDWVLCFKHSGNSGTANDLSTLYQRSLALTWSCNCSYDDHNMAEVEIGKIVFC